MRKEIDISAWDRKDHFEFYSNIATPHYCVAFNIDITNLLAFTRKNKISFIIRSYIYVHNRLMKLTNFCLKQKITKSIKSIDVCLVSPI